MKANILLISLLSASLYGQLQEISGTLDPTFGGSGTGFNTVAISGGNDGLNSIAIDVQGRIVGGGSTSGDTLIIRFNPNGTLDNSFGGSGTGFNVVDLGGTERITSIFIDPSGRIVAGGEASTGALIMRFNSDGTLDTSFGGSGTGFNIVTALPSSEIFAISIDTEGRIVGVGRESSGAFIVRFNPDGTLDTSFGGNGTGFDVISFSGINDSFQALIIDDQNRPVAGGLGTPDDFGIVARFTDEGLLDTSFGGSGTGFVFIDALGGLDFLSTIIIDSQNRIIVGGLTIIGASEAFIAGLTQNGVLDSTFGGNGTGINEIDFGGSDGIQSLAIDPQGKIIAGANGASAEEALVARFLSNGTIDSTFGPDGTGFTRVDTDPEINTIVSIVISPQGRIVAGGNTGPFGTQNILILRVFNEPLTQLTTALREKYCNAINPQ